MIKYFIGTDIGTQSTRVIIYDTAGKEISRGSCKHPAMVSPQQGWMEHGKYDLWEAFCKAAQQAMAGYSGTNEELGGISFAYQSTTLFPISAEGEILYNAISWMDGRTVPEAEDLPENLSEDLKIASKTAKANWFKRVKPEVYAQTDKFLTAGGMISFMLTGSSDESLAGLLNNWPVDRPNWAPTDDDMMFKCYGMEKTHMGKLVMPGTLLGTVTPKAAQLTGLPEGLAVYAGALDKESEFVGSGITQPNKAYITTGTCTTMARVSDKYVGGKFCTFAPIKGLYNYPVIVGKGFWIVSWFRDNLGQDLAAKASAEGKSIEQLLEEEAEGIPAGSNGLLVLPEWMPIMGVGHNFGKGMFVGFDDRHHRGHMYKALMEGIVMQMKQGFEADKGSGILDEISELRIGGGGSQSSMFMQIVADVFGTKVIRASTTETCSLGAAMYAAVGSGVYKDLADAAAHMTSDTDVFTPIPENQEFYSHWYEEVFSKTYDTLLPVLKNISKLTSDADIQFFI